MDHRYQAGCFLESSRADASRVMTKHTKYYDDFEIPFIFCPFFCHFCPFFVHFFVHIASAAIWSHGERTHPPPMSVSVMPSNPLTAEPPPFRLIK